VAQFLGDPRKTLYLLLWRDEKWSRGSACPRIYDGEIKEAVRLARYHDPHDASAAENYVELKRTDGDYSVIRIVWRMPPRNGGRTLFLFCPYCQLWRRALYGWQVDHWGRYTNSARTCSWRCRACTSLRYASTAPGAVSDTLSEGGALVLRSRWSFIRMIEQQYGFSIWTLATPRWARHGLSRRTSSFARRHPLRPSEI
jgi:hypothetical protein